MNASPVTKDKEKKNEVVDTKTSFGKSGNKNEIKISYTAERVDTSKLPTIRDGIHKEIIRQERRSEISWEKKYDYLSGKFFQQILAEEAEKAGLPSDTFKRRETDIDNISLVKNFDKKLPTSPPIPKTSSAFVGWRSSSDKYRLEFEGSMYISPKRTISPPPESETLQITNQRFIFLG